MAGDFIPHADGAFLEWAKTLTSYVAAHLTGFNIQEAALAPIQTLLAGYQTAYDRAENPNRGKVDVLAKNEARDALKAALRTFIKAYLTYNPEVTDVDKGNMGLPLHDSTRTPVPAPSTIPEIELDSSVIRQISAHFRDSGSGRRGKPQGVHGAELRWSLLETAPVSIADLRNSAFATATPYIFSFDEPDRGKTLYICPHWENNKGDKGPWGEIVKAIVP
ncbi:hypothetical protein [Treponema endosymbiont of Eucomonympha sp.]|uniref:hypothetical protein n=2 Tax=Treponema endosymbiont of Eucomonympha sp. TaxID=1580831 RepID=UPI0007516748|nr:hypothetical protein [Treponema endosymbiont of Eucomonympha sp.]